MKKPTIAVAVLALALVVPAVSACTSSQDSSGGSTATSAWQPLRLGIEQTKETVELKVGETAYFGDLPSAGQPFVVSSDNTSVVTVLQPTDDTTTVTTLPDPGITAVAVGEAKVTVRASGSEQDAEPILAFNVKVVE